MEKEAVVLKIVKRSDANAVEVVRNIQNSMDEIIKTLPGGMRLTWFDDNGQFVNASVDSTIVNIFSGIILTSTYIIFLFILILDQHL